MYILNGRFTARLQTGQERFACNLIIEIDKICKPNEFTLVCPIYAKYVPKLNNIRIIKYGKIKRDLWEQISFYNYIKKNGGIPVNLTTTCSARIPGIVCLHDMLIMEHPEFYKGIYGKLSKIWHLFLLKKAIKNSIALLTVSEYSKNKINEFFNYDINKIYVLGNGWDHFTSVNEDDTVFSKYDYLIKNNYYFAVSSITPQKNFVWIKEIAKKNIDSIFVIAGSFVGLSNNKEMKDIPCNLKFIGRISDSEMKSLMMNCKAYLQPSIYEGFGIPPLEALSCGAQIIISNTSCFPEIFKNCAHYIDPFNYDVNLDNILKEDVTTPNVILEKYKWKKIGEKFYNDLRDING